MKLKLMIVVVVLLSLLSVTTYSFAGKGGPPCYPSESEEEKVERCSRIYDEYYKNCKLIELSKQSGRSNPSSKVPAKALDDIAGICAAKAKKIQLGCLR